MMSNGQSRPIVIGVDFSQPSIEAARWAVKWLATNGKFILVHALVVPEIDGILADRFPLPSSLLSNARAGASRRLEELASTMAPAKPTLEIREGRPADVLSQMAMERDAELVVVGKHGESGMQRGYTGRTADRLVRTASAPVLVVEGRPLGPPRTILVALTYSSITPYVVEWVRKIHDLTGALVIAIHVVGSAVLSHVLTMSAVRTGEALAPEELDEVFSEDRERWKGELTAAGIPADNVQTEVVFGEVSDAVLAAAREHAADLIVMGSHAGPVRRALLGSAAGAVLRRAECPTMIVTEPGEPGVATPANGAKSARIKIEVLPTVMSGGAK